MFKRIASIMILGGIVATVSIPFFVSKGDIGTAIFRIPIESELKTIDDAKIPLGGSPDKGVQTVVAINTIRESKGESPLLYSDALATAAQLRANECEINFSHTRPDGSQFWTADPDFIYGENLGYNYSTPESIVDAWSRSPGHMANMTNPEYLTAGAAWSQNGEYSALELGY